jgi:tetratricopeptide (TPR) repeat protein
MQRPRPETFDDLAARLQARRVEAGSPSFGEIATRIGEQRRRDGGGDRPAPARSTVYDCFREGRRRVDIALVLEIVAALGADRAETGIWRAWCAALQGETSRRPVVLTGFAGLPPQAVPFVVPAKALAQTRRAKGAVVVVGMPGVGKTQLASAAVAAEIADGRTRDAVTVDVRGSDPTASPADGRAVVDAIARLLGMDAQESMPDGERVAMVADELGRTGTAVLLDDVAGAEQFAALSRAVSTRLIATSRSASALSRAATIVSLAPWSEDETIGLLRAHLDDDRLEREADAARSLAALTGGLPLATSIIAGRIARAEDWSLADHGARIQAGLGRLHLDDGVHLAFSQSYDALDEEQRRALRLLAAQPCSHLAVSFAKDLLDRSDAASDALLRELHGAHLIAVGDRVWMHRLVRVFVLARSWEEDPRSMRDAAVDRLVGAYLSALPSADAGWIRREVGHLIDLANAIAPRRADALVEMTTAVSDRLDAQGMFRSAEALQRLAYESALGGGSDEARTTTALALGRTLVRLGSSRAEAILTEALGWAERTGAGSQACSAANSLAVLASMRGDQNAALQRFRDSMGWAERIERRDLQGRLHDNIAITLRRLGRLEEARTHHETALEIAEGLGDDALSVTVLGNLSELLLLIGDATAALDAASTALERGDGGGDFWRASALNNLGRALSASGRHDLAIARQRQALDLALATGAPALISAVRNDMAATHVEAGDADAAGASLESALDVARDGGVVFEQARALLGLAERDAASGAHEVAAVRAREALALLPEEDAPEARRARAVLEGS